MTAGVQERTRHLTRTRDAETVSEWVPAAIYTRISPDKSGAGLVQKAIVSAVPTIDVLPTVQRGAAWPSNRLPLRPVVKP